MKINICRLTNEQDKDKYHAMITEILTEQYANIEVKKDNYFIDFLREAPEVCDFALSCLFCTTNRKYRAI